jgi:hypothetical protein
MWVCLTVAILVEPTRDNVAVVVGNHKVSSKKKSEAEADVTLRYSLTPLTKLSPLGLAVGILDTVTV